MSILSEFSRIGASMANARRARMTERALRHLPPEIRKDIGMPVADRPHNSDTIFLAVWNAAR
jgi:hypothetical protein